MPHVGRSSLVAFGLAASWAAVALGQGNCNFVECGAPAAAGRPSLEQRSRSMPETAPLPQSGGRTFWNHNGSVMYLIVDGNRREFYYHQPRQGMMDEGVRPGTLLFTGSIAGNAYEGTAYFFSARCGARPYQVSGSAQENGGRVIMTGTGAVINKRCEYVRAINDVLIFDYLYRE